MQWNRDEVRKKRNAKQIEAITQFDKALFVNRIENAKGIINLFASAFSHSAFTITALTLPTAHTSFWDPHSTCECVCEWNWKYRKLLSLKKLNAIAILNGAHGTHFIGISQKVYKFVICVFCLVFQLTRNTFAKLISIQLMRPVTMLCENVLIKSPLITFRATLFFVSPLRLRSTRAMIIIFLGLFYALNFL